MKKMSCIWVGALLIGCHAMAQKHDTIPVKPLIEKGSKGDLIIGNKNKQQQLGKSVQVLSQTDSLHKRKGCKLKNCKKQQ